MVPLVLFPSIFVRQKGLFGGCFIYLDGGGNTGVINQQLQLYQFIPGSVVWVVHSGSESPLLVSK